MSETKKTDLNKIMSWDGKNYGPGVVDLPAKAADYAKRRGFGTILGESSGDENFKPLSPKETINRFGEGDVSDEVVESLKYWQTKFIEGAKEGKSPVHFQEEFEEQQNSESTSAKEKSGGENGKSQENSEDKFKGSNAEPAVLPEDFPNRKAFEKLGFKSVEEIQAKTRDDLIAMKGIAETSVDAALAYGKK